MAASGGGQGGKVAPAYAPSGAKWGGPKSPGAGWHGIGGGWWAPPKPSKAPATAKPSSQPITSWTNPKNPLANPDQTLSGKTLIQAAQALANAQTNPAIGQLQDQINLGNKFAKGQENTLNSYYQGLEKYATQGTHNIDQTNQAVQAGLGQLGTQTQNTLSGIGTAGQNELSQYAPGDPSLHAAGTQALAQEMARQQGYAAQDIGNLKGTGLVTGGIQSNLANSNLGAYAAAGREDITRLGQANLQKMAPLESKIAQLRANRGNLIAANLGKLRQQEITNKFTSQGLNLKQQANQITAANDQAKNAIAAGTLTLGQAKLNEVVSKDQAANQLGWANLNVKQQNDLATQAWHQAQVNSKGAQSGQVRRLTPRQNATFQSQLDQALGAIDGLRTAGENDATIKQSLSTGNVQTPDGHRVPAVPSILVEAAYELKGWGYITPATAQAMHNMGMYSNTFRGQPIRVQSRAPVDAGNAAANAFGGPIGFTS